MDELERLDKLIKAVNRGGYFRCVCNAVSNERIETNIGDYRPNLSFTHDPKDHRHFICVDCAEAIEDLRQDYEYLDEDNEEVSYR